MGGVDIRATSGEFLQAAQAALKPIAVCDADKFKLYGYFKQGTVGPPLASTKPFASIAHARKKQEAWAAVSALSKEEAIEGYCRVVDRIVPSWRKSDVLSTTTEERPTLKRAATTTPASTRRPTLLESADSSSAIGSSRVLQKAKTTSWKKQAGRDNGKDSYQFGDLTRSLIGTQRVLHDESRQEEPQIVAKEQPGNYRIITRAILGEDQALDSPDLQWLEEGTIVNVLDVVSVEEAKRVRGRVEEPAGWVSLVALDSRDRWASPTEEALRLVTPTEVTTASIPVESVEVVLAPVEAFAAELVAEVAILAPVVPQDEHASSGEDRPGNYRIVASAILGEGQDLESEDLRWLGEGEIITVLEIVHNLESKRLRGRVAAPAGWISLLALDDGHRWASPTNEAVQLENELVVLLDPVVSIAAPVVKPAVVEAEVACMSSEVSPTVETSSPIEVLVCKDVAGKKHQFRPSFVALLVMVMALIMRRFPRVSFVAVLGALLAGQTNRKVFIEGDTA